ncbi:MAG: hypothetical protein PHI35_07785, partial [Victivallaceae bacterium]|nr:hypothetical protein [Victivallaceae bacterium]
MNRPTPVNQSPATAKPIIRRFNPWRWLASFVCRDFWRKAIALFFAILVYFAVRQQISEVQTMSGVPVEIALPAGLVNANPKPVTVTLTVRGSRRDLQSRIKPMGRVEVDENRFVSGKSYRIELAPADFTSTNGIQ